MNTQQDSSAKVIYEPWLEAMKTLVTFQWKLFEMQYQVGMNTLEKAVGSVSNPSAKGEPAHRYDVQQLEQLAAERLEQGLAPPREIYQVPYRTRIDWSKFPEWAKPSDPEMFEGSAHEG